jgi:DNA topoisomerase 2-associated protein PAT1
LIRLDFEDTYDGLGDQLDETGDDFNDDTFGGGSSAPTQKAVGKDFDFSGRTAQVSDAINEEQARYARQQPVTTRAAPTQNYAQPMSKPARSGYERYKEPEYIPEMQVDRNLWGVAPKRATPVPASESPAPPGLAAGGRKMMSLEEVEAAMRAGAQAKKTTPAPAPTQPQYEQSQQQYPPSQQYQQYPQQHQPQFVSQGNPQEESRSTSTGQPIQILQRPQQPQQQQRPLSGLSGPPISSGPPPPTGPSQPTQILQNPNRYSAEQHRPPPQNVGHHSRPSGSRHIITHPQQLAGLSEEERATFLEQDAKRAKRNHKIHQMSKDNGLMTPQDKNFITRIQLQQLVTATGNPNEHGSDSALAEDFYYQVIHSIRGGPRQHPGQPLNNFAQTYLFQTGGRHGNMRRQARGGDNHVQRMEQQVQRAVEAAKNKPKNKQLVIEGSLGKISFSNAKTPKPLLNIKRPDSSADRPHSSPKKAPVAGISGIDKKTVLQDIENVYSTLMLLEDHARLEPPPVDDINPHLVGLHMDWQEKARKLNSRLWYQLKVHEPIGATAVHPFIAILSFAKGKKAIPRVFRHISQEQRTTILTMIVVHLDRLDVVRLALLKSDELQLNAAIRENIDIFSLNVMPPLFTFLNEAGLDIVTGVLGLILTHTNIDIVARTRIGVSMLTMILSRSELMKQSEEVNDQEWDQWYVHPTLMHILTNILGSSHTMNFLMLLSQPFPISSLAQSTPARMFTFGNFWQPLVSVPAQNNSNDWSWLLRTVLWRLWLLLRLYLQPCPVNDWQTSIFSCVPSVWMSNYLHEIIMRDVFYLSTANFPF